MPDRIPDVFHFIFGLHPERQPFHLAHYLCVVSCLEVNKPDAVVVHIGQEPTGRWWQAVRDRVTVERVSTDTPASAFSYPDRSTARFRYAHHADFLRLQILLEHGGAYADIDSLFLAPLPERIRQAPFTIGREDDVNDRTGRAQPSLCNALLAAQPGSEFAGCWLEQMASAFDGSWSGHSTLLPARLAEEQPEALLVEPPATFYPYMWTREGLQALFGELHTPPPGAASIHLWAHLWWSRRRLDFSRFHAGRLTPSYVRKARTTYAALAAPYLD